MTGSKRPAQPALREVLARAVTQGLPTLNANTGPIADNLSKAVSLDAQPMRVAEVDNPMMQLKLAKLTCCRTMAQPFGSRPAV